MKRLNCEKEFYMDERGNEAYRWIQEKRPDRGKVEAEIRTALYAEYTLSAIEGMNYEDCDLETLRNVLRYLKRYRKDIKTLAGKVHAVYETKVISNKIRQDIDKLSPEERAIYKEELAKAED